MVPLLPDETDLLGGLEGGIPIVDVLQCEGPGARALRAQAAKTYGTCKLAEGPAVTGVG